MIPVLFTCHRCGLQRCKVFVRERSPGEDVAAWMKVVAEAAGKRHAYLSPTCRENKCDLLIPLPKEQGKAIGESAPADMQINDPDLLKSRGAN